MQENCPRSPRDYDSEGLQWAWELASSPMMFRLLVCRHALSRKDVRHLNDELMLFRALYLHQLIWQAGPINDLHLTKKGTGAERRSAKSASGGTAQKWWNRDSNPQRVLWIMMPITGKGSVHKYFVSNSCTLSLALSSPAWRKGTGVCTMLEPPWDSATRRYVPHMQEILAGH